MSAATRLSAFALVLAATFGGGWALGAAFGPEDPVPPPDHNPSHSEPQPSPSALMCVLSATVRAPSRAFHTACAAARRCAGTSSKSITRF